MGFAAYWRWKSRSPGGRPRVAKEMRDLIRRMSLENPFWGATKIHGELLKLGIQVAQSTVSIYMAPRPDRPLQSWKTFVRNHMEGIASIIMMCGRTFRLGRPRLVDGRSSASGTLLRIRSLADYTINTLGSSFRKRQVLVQDADDVAALLAEYLLELSRPRLPEIVRFEIGIVEDWHIEDRQLVLKILGKLPVLPCE